MYLGLSPAEADATGWRGIDEGGKLKEAGVEHWRSPNVGDTNESGFTSLPGGCRSDNGYFDHMGSYAFFWSSTEGSSSGAWNRHLYYHSSATYRYNTDKPFGFSVRCVKD